MIIDNSSFECPKPYPFLNYVLKSVTPLLSYAVFAQINPTYSGARLKLHSKFFRKQFCCFGHLPNRVQKRMIPH